MSNILITKSHGQKIVASLISDYSNHPVMFDAEASVILSLDGLKLGKEARPDCSGDTLDFFMSVGNKNIVVEHKTTGADLKVMDETDSLFKKISSKGFQVSECGWAPNGKKALEQLVLDTWKVNKATGTDTHDNQLLVTIHHETKTHRYLQIYVLNFWDILSHCYFGGGKKVTWSGGNKLIDRSSGATLLTFECASRTRVMLSRSGMELFNPVFLASGVMERRHLNYWTKNV
jgi:hypothetical protein